MKIIAVIPVKGREDILRLTIPKLTKQVDKVIISGHGKEECLICEDAGADYYFCNKMTRGEKWQFAIDKARGFDPDAILIMSSGAVISDNYCEELFKDKCSMTGRAGLYFWDFQPTMKRMMYWPGYIGGRSVEPIGVGRMIFKSFLDRCDWQVYDKRFNTGLDFRVMGIMQKYGGDVHINKSDVYSMRISSYKYPQTNGYDRLIRDSRIRVVENQDEILKKIGII